VKKQPDFLSIFSDDFREYLDYVRAGGRVYQGEEYILRAFDRYIIDKNSAEITEELVNGFTYSKPDLPPHQYSKRHRIVMDFVEYLFYRGKSPSISQSVKNVSPERCIPHIYTQDEIGMLLSEAKKLNPSSSLRPQTYYTLLGLLASTGLRISEAIHLGVEDVDLHSGILYIRNTKFYKSRLVPVHQTTLDALKQYWKCRNNHFPESKKAFFLNNLGLPLNYVTVIDAFLQIARNSGVRTPKGKGPRIHDFRHTFAVSRVLAWYESGEDVNLLLAQLATYMGHTKFRDTVYYLDAGAMILEKGSHTFVSGGGSND